MTTIDKLDIGIYVQYARRTELLEQINQQYHLQEASSIPTQVRVIDFYPRPLEIDFLLGHRIVQPSWALFHPPPKFRYQRRSPFGFFRVAPSLGSFEKEEENENQFDDIETDTEEEKKEKKILKSCFTQIGKINEWMGFIIGRIGQFLQG